MRVDGNSIDIGQQTSPRGEATDTVAHGDECTLAFTDTRDFTNDLVGLQVAGGYVLNELNTKAKGWRTRIARWFDQWSRPKAR